MSLGGALAIFVKTPGLSPIKTRLASSIGVESANRFYELAVAATRAVAGDLQDKIPNLHLYWAVAEEAGLDANLWSSFTTVFQGNGGLGRRLHTVYEELLKRHHYVCFVGADSPHLSPELIKSGILLTAKHLHRKFVLGETIDGGFYFFGGSVPLPPGLWLGVEYSTCNTARQLKSKLSQYGEIELLKPNFDVDTADDLRRYSHLEAVLPEQQELIRWARTIR